MRIYTLHFPGGSIVPRQPVATPPGGYLASRYPVVEQALADLQHREDFSDSDVMLVSVTLDNELLVVVRGPPPGSPPRRRTTPVSTEIAQL